MMMQNNIIDNDINFMSTTIDSIVSNREYMLPSEYCESIRYLPPELTPMPGYYNYDRFPYLREIVDNFSPESPIREVAVLKAAQIGATTGLLEAIILYFIGAVPRSQVFVSADRELAKKGMNVKIDRMLDHSGIRDLIKSQTGRKTRKTGDTDMEKEYAGGFLHGIGAQSPGKMRQMNYQVGVVDELDGMPDKFKNEGSVLALLLNRILVPYEETGKVLYLSTPTVTQTSKIIPLYEQGDRRHYNVPCKNCGDEIVLHWHLKDSQTKTGDEAGLIYKTLESGKLIRDSVRYKCQLCGKEMENEDKSIILIEGKWKPTQETLKDFLRSYWLNALYSPVGIFSWAGIVEAWLKCWDIKKNKIKDIEEYRSFRNTKQGLGFEEMGEAPKYERVIQHQRNYSSNEIPNKMCIADNGYPILIVLCSADIHKNNITIDIKGYTIGGKSYTIDYRVIEGDTGSIKNEPWLRLTKIIEDESWTSDDGKIYRIRTTFIDAAYGERTPQVYEFCKQYSGGVHPIFGEQWISGEYGGIAFKEASDKTIKKAGCLVYKINTTITKNRVASAFRSDWNVGEDQPDWKPNFPEDFRDDYFRQFEAEYKAKKVDNATGKTLGFFWKQIEGRDNHAFDTFGYNIAALECVADFACRERLKLDTLNWNMFWEFALTGAYYEIKDAS